MTISIQLFYQLMGLAAVSVVVSVVAYAAVRLTPIGKISMFPRSCIAGVMFGIVAILGTQFGVDVGGAIANARDAAPICAGLIFGAPAGIIAGIIGGLWRWFAPNAGDYSRLACSISTALAGIIAALLRKYMFDNKRPGCIFGFAIAGVIEVLHLTILFLTHLEDPTQAFEIVKLCTIPMILCNGISVMAAILLVSFVSQGIVHRKEKRFRNIAQLVQTPLLITVMVAFAISSQMIYTIQTNSSRSQSDELIDGNLASISLDILNESDQKILTLAHSVANAIETDPDTDLEALCLVHGLSEIYLVNENGIIIASSTGENVGYDMNSDADLPENEQQSCRFMVLLDENCNEYVQECMPMATNSEQNRKYAGVSLSSGGFIQVGYDQDAFEIELKKQIKILVTNRQVGEEGYIFVTDSDYKVVSADETYDGHDLSEYGIQGAEVPNNILQNMTIAGSDYFLKTITSEGFHIFAIMTAEEVYASRNNMMYIYAYMEVLIFSVLFVVIYMIVKKLIVNNIRSVNTSLGKIIGGNLDTTVDVHSSEEFASLSNDINSTVETLKRYIDEAEKRIDKELAFAKSIQFSTLPSVFPAYPNQTMFDVFATMDTAKEVGGDFYDFYYVGENKFAILIADVSGKGIPAALFMMRAKTTIKGLAESGLSVDEILTKANEKLCESNDLDMFVTVWMGIVDLKTGHVTYANAGHNSPVILRKSGEVDYLKTGHGLVLAGMEGVRYRKWEMDLSKGDRIFLYTDGVTEATDVNNQLYGDDRLLEFMRMNTSLTINDSLLALKEDLDAFVGEADQFDDITMLLFEYLESKENSEETHIESV